MKYLLLALFLIPNAQAETRLNAAAGVDFAKVTDTDSDSYAATHLLGGVSAAFGLTGSLYLMPGLRYVEKGVGYRSVSSSFDIDIKIKYLEVPVYVKFYLLKGSVNPFVYAGPNLGIKLGDSVSYKFTLSGATYQGKETGTLGDSIRTLNVTLDAGLGVDFALSESMTLFLAGGYSAGITSISTGSSDAKTRDIQAFAGASIRL